MRTKSACFLLLCLISSAPWLPTRAAAAEPTSLPTANVDHEGLKKLNWQLLIEPTAMGDPTIFEAIDRLHAMVVHHINLVEGQPISPEHADVVLNADASAEQTASLLAKVKAVKMDFVTLSVTDPMTDEAQCRKVLDLARALKVKRIICRPTADAMPILDKLADEYKIGISIANSSAGPYKDAASLLAALQGRSARFTACADVAEFELAGIVPLDAVKTLSGHLTDVRFATVNSIAIPEELKNQKFKGATILSAVDTAKSPGPFIDSLNAFSEMVKKIAAEN